MKISYLAIFGFRFLSREWPRYILAAASLFVTSVTFVVVLVGVDGAKQYLDGRSREFVGGDISFRSSTPFDGDVLLGDIAPNVIARDEEVELPLAVRSASGTASVNVRAITDGFPLYGEVGIASGSFAYPGEDGAYLARAALERLGVGTGDDIYVGQTSYRVLGEIVSEPDAVLAGFQFAPTMIISRAGLGRTEINLAESRGDYEVRYRFREAPSENIIKRLRERAAQDGIRISVAGDGQSGFLRGLENVERFFLVVILVGAILAAVNVYANSVNMIDRLRKSFAVLLVQGTSERSVVALVLGVIGSVTIVASLFGVAFGLLLVFYLYRIVGERTGITLPFVIDIIPLALVFGGTLATSLAATLPAVRNLLSLTPRMLLSGESSNAEGSRRLPAAVGITFISFLPLFFLARYFLESWLGAVYVIGGTLVAYLLVAGGWSLLLKIAYQARFRFGFYLRALIAQKKAEGIFGIVAVSSLFIALASIFTLTLAEKSLERFFDNGLASTLPRAYILDVQKDQVEAVTSVAPGITLFPNIRARLTRIDERMIQKNLDSDNPSESGELRREFNLTYRTELLGDEEVVEGEWQGTRSGEVSLERDFAKRAGISLGSEIEFFIQGLPVVAKVTSIRTADTSSGRPFFYFVMSPEALGRFPASYFGLLDGSDIALPVVEKRLAEKAPNITVIDTAEAGRTVREVTGAILVILSSITIPPLLLATILLFTLLATNFASRRKDLVRLRVLGVTERAASLFYLADTTSLLLISMTGSLIISAGTVLLLTRFYLDGIEPVLFDVTEARAAIALIFAIITYSLAVLYFDKRSMREELSYEENN